jgi:hypothetical protein
MQIRLFLAALCLSSSLSATSAQHVLFQSHGIPQGNLGTAMMHVADTNNDGFDDLLVGQTENNNGQPGAVLCYSGKYFATGVQPEVLWVATPPTSSAGRFGSSMCEVATLTGDGATDFVIGMPNYQPTLGNTTGALFLVDGSTHQVVATIVGDTSTHLGQALVAVGDQDGDGKIDFAASAPQVAPSNNNSYIHIFSGGSFTAGTHTLATVTHWSRQVGWHDYGAAMASGFDLDGDGLFDLATSTPTYGFTFSEAGYIEVRRATPAQPLIGACTMNIAGEHFGASLDCRHDYNGDGAPDLIVGAPNWTPGFTGTQDGRVVVVSGAALMNGNLPLVLYTLSSASGPAPATAHFGAAVCASEDLNHDGVGDILVGAPEYKPSFPVGASVKGALHVYSGKTGVRIGGFVGGSNDHLGNAIVGGFDFLDGDTFLDFAVAASLADSPYTDCGIVRALRLFPCAPSTYCTAKTNSLGCTPSVASTGSPSVNPGALFVVTCSNLINQKSGIFFYSHRPLSAPFQGGFLCVQGPSIRIAEANSGGSATGADCTGGYTLDFAAQIHGGFDPSLVAGAEVFGQFQSRDQQSPSGTSLSNALRFVVQP